MKNKKSILWFVLAVIFIVILVLLIFQKDEVTDEAGIKNLKVSSEHHELNLTLYHPGVEEALKKFGYIEEKEGKFYEGVLELKSYTQENPGETRIIYRGEGYELEDRYVKEGITWIEVSRYLKVDNIDDPPLQKEVIVKYKDRLYKGTMDLELGKEIDLGNKKVAYYGALYYDENLVDSDITDE